MRIKVSHQTHYAYAAPAKSVIQILRLTPRSHEGHHVIGWRIDVDLDCQLRADQDAFGNLSHRFSVEGPVAGLTVSVSGEIETFDTSGVIAGTVERFPPEFYLRETELTQAGDALRGFALASVKGAGAPLERLHALLGAVNGAMAFDTSPTDTGTSAAQAFALKRGVCQDFAHIFIACARHIAIPARYAGGYFLRSDGIIDQEAGHAWAEAYVADLGWVGFDPANGISTHESHVRVAIALDYLGAAPVRGTRFGGAGETLKVGVRVSADAQSQSQRQTQS